MNAFAWLNGKKTYIGLIAAGVFGLAVSAGWIKFEDYEWLAVLIGTWTGVAITHKANKATAAVAALAGSDALPPPLTLADTVTIREGEACDQCGDVFAAGDRIFQRASPHSIVCEKCLKPTDLLVGQVQR